MSTFTRASVFVAAAWLLGALQAPAQSASSAQAWLRWEQALTSTKSPANPYAQVTLSVTYSGPGGATYNGQGFWDGGTTFRIRFKFPSAGTWTWRTSCSDATDAGLHNRTGTVSVIAPAGTNPLYRNGGIRTSGNRRHLEHSNGTPFLVVADTAWLAYTRASQADWENYINHRRARNFTTIVLSVGSKGDNTIDATDRAGNTPFLGGGVSMWNPAFWREFDRKVQYANDQGIYLVVTGLAVSRMANATQTELVNFTRNLSARLAGNFVAISPRQDWGGLQEGALNLLGNTAHQAAPLLLVTQHAARSNMPQHALDLHRMASTDFSGVQTGPGWTGDREPINPAICTQATIEWIGAVYRDGTTKPVVNLEGVYDDDTFAAGETPGVRTTMVRRGAYLSMLSGACGFTSSSFGVWTWGMPIFNGQWGTPPPLSTGMNRPYATFLNHFSQFFRGMEWWTLVPRQDLIRNQTTDWSRKMVLARSANGSLAVAFLPDNPAIEVDMAAFPTPMSARWFNPNTGGYQDISSSIANSGIRSFPRPGGGDWALLLRATGTPPPPPPPPPPPGGALGTWSFDEASGTTAADSSGNGNTATLFGGTTRVAGISGGAVRFDGASGHARVPATSTLNSVGNQMTVSAWIYRELDQPACHVIANRQFGSAFDDQYILALVNNGYIFGVHTTAGYPIIYGNKSPQGQWIHFAGTYDGGTIRMYVNGALAGSLAASGNVVSDPSKPLVLGAGQNDATGGVIEHFGGRIDDVRLYGRALSGSEIQSLAGGTSPVPAGGLKGEYFDNLDFTALKVTRTDATVNFDWTSGSPASGVAADTFSTRWTGFVEAPASGTYTFYTVSDDGVRLWVNGQPLVNNWTLHSATENAGTIVLTGGQKVSVKMEFYENGGLAVAKLLWSGPGIAKQVIPSNRLFLQ